MGNPFLHKTSSLIFSNTSTSSIDNTLKLSKETGCSGSLIFLIISNTVSLLTSVSLPSVNSILMFLYLLFDFICNVSLQYSELSAVLFINMGLIFN
ncbi:hypothetical protein A0H76_2005 [Hepatospora eriocheir]|uniref:Uncharacterized protein n=1 Tax=Hepatospora eriocheir TaxID=1081669 RepID=A0A1X0QG63_9MICR|nr:hypothetical protein A0H76_2005 [Hepatospora eriocheir]